MESFETKVGSKIRYLREKAGYSREYLCEKSNIGTKFLYEIESGKKGMSAYTLYNISKALNISCDYLLRDDIETTDISHITAMLSNLSKRELLCIERIIFNILDVLK